MEQKTTDDGYEKASRGAHAAKNQTGSEAAAQASQPQASQEETRPQTAEKEEQPAYMQMSHRMRRRLIAVIVVLVVLLAAAAGMSWYYLSVSSSAGSQQATGQPATSIDGDDQINDASTNTGKTATVPTLTALLGMTQDQALEELQDGAQVASTSEVNEEDNPIKTTARVVLTAESGDTASGTPTVYLGFDEDGKIVQAGYSASTSSLGYGELSFSDIIEVEHIVENTFADAGIELEEGTVQLPEDKAEYSTYASDGTTLTRERCSFSGTVDIDGAEHEWSAVLSYDYSSANASDNLSDTVRTIYIYINS